VIVLNEMDVKKALKIMMAEADVPSVSDLAEQLEVPASTLRSALNNNALKVRDLMKIADLIGYEIVAVKKDK